MANPIQLKQQVPHTNPSLPFRVFDIVPPERQIMHLHWHDDWEIVWFKRGTVVFHIGSERIRPGPGDLLFVNSGLIHTGFAEDDRPVEYAAIVFHPSAAGGPAADPLQRRVVDPFVTGSSFFPVHVPSGHPQYAALLGIVQGLIDEYAARSVGFELAIRAKLHLLLIHLIRHHDAWSGPTRAHAVDREQYASFKKLIALIEERYADKWTVSQASSIVNVSEYHFCRTFKRITGKTFVEYVNLHRINVAERLLLETSAPVTDIAYLVGFGSVNYFSQLFKQYKRVSPSQCRKRS
ncbi:AraC family transcriptional regulator [Paenibacillus sp.]|uniref:helix-turn-helix transcriptional regulator n=1 Tax=Paenibacillus sp. TaxID=58172 RepID=UPI002D2B1BCB|nr:AraC family transcriptional regulator [Paenibacillus sp.]HZG85958.1 AraC family transcriptional regulator [Paenibacillus sp.]